MIHEVVDYFPAISLFSFYTYLITLFSLYIINLDNRFRGRGEQERRPARQVNVMIHH